MHVFLDESGGLSFDFTKGGTTRFFVVCLLVIPTSEDHRKIINAVERTIHHKLHKGRKPKRPTDELKGSQSELATLRYFYRQASAASFSIYALMLSKAAVPENLRQQPGRLYDLLATDLLEHCPFHRAQERIVLTLDRRKSSGEIKAFNQALLIKLQATLPITRPIDIFHLHSWERKGLQAVDLFCWGMFRKYERGDTTWYDVFKERIAGEATHRF
jgi:hypothetical protein